MIHKFNRGDYAITKEGQTVRILGVAKYYEPAEDGSLWYHVEWENGVCDGYEGRDLRPKPDLKVVKDSE